MNELAAIRSLLSNHLFQIALEIRREWKPEIEGRFASDLLGRQCEEIRCGLVCVDEPAFEIQHIDRVRRRQQNGAEQPGLHLLYRRILLQRFGDGLIYRLMEAGEIFKLLASDRGECIRPVRHHARA